MRRIALALAAALLVPAALGQQLYKWVDSQGKVHYSDRPPTGPVKGEQTIKPPPPGPAPSATGAQSLQEQELEFRKRQIEAQEARTKAEAEAKVKKENCDRAQSNLKTYQEGGRIFRYNAQGERYYIDDETRQKEIAKWQQEVAKWCQ